MRLGPTATRRPRPARTARAAQRARPLALAAVLLVAGSAGGAAASAAGSGEPADPGPRLAAPPGASGRAAFDGEADRVAATLLAERPRVRPGERLRVGVLFQPDPGWHIYWRSPGDAGIATALDWDVAGARIGAIEWPAPKAFAEPDGLGGTVTTYGYDGHVLLPAEASVSKDVRDFLRLRVTARFLACRISCIPGSIELTRDLPVVPVDGADGRAPRNAQEAVVEGLFERAYAAVPAAAEAHGLEVKALYSQSALRPGDDFEAALIVGCGGRRDCRAPTPAPGAFGYAFIPDPIDGVELRVLGARPHPLTERDYVVALQGSVYGDDPGRRDERLTGVVALRLPNEQPRVLEVDVPFPRAAAGEPVAMIGTPWLAESGEGADGGGARPAGAASVPLGRALALALLGGLILNLMPCVLPVLAIKVFAVTEMAHGARREVLAQGAAYAAGVVLSMLALAAVVTALRAGGQSIGWGFQFQEPLFVAAICAVLVVFALNLFGVFEIFAPTGSLAGIGATASGARRSFFEGLLAVVLATPCSAPFLGTAVGFAFAASPAVIFAIFAAIGVGLAAPFVVITWVPGWTRFVPRPGAWMLTLRAGLGFAVLATVVWLLWVVGRLVGPEGMVALLGFLVAVAFAAWVCGVLQRSGRMLPARAIALGATAAALAGLAGLPLDPTSADAARPGQQDGALGARSFERDALEATLAAGRPAFVYFTADWCITCKVNERGTLRDDSVEEALVALGFEVFRADWTQRDEEIRRELARFGKAGVPLYLVYAAGGDAAPRVLPELLTPGIVLDALHAAAGTRS